MTKTYVAYTHEVNDADLALSEIKSQLNDGLLKNTLGIVACHNKFVESGVVKKIGEELPFDVVGAISTGQSNGVHTDELLFTIMIITSDDMTFRTGVTGSLAKDPIRAITECYKAAADGMFGRPSLILPYAPFIMQNSGDDYVNALSKASYGAPCFGTIAADGSVDFSACYTILNGETHGDQLVMALFYGNVKPKFYVANICDDKIFEKSATITKSENNIIMEIDDKPVIEYFNEMGLSEALKTRYTLASLPFLLDYHDRTPLVSKIFVSLTKENYAVCAGAVPEGSTIYIASNERNDILTTTGSVMDQIMSDAQNANGLLIYSCMSRSMAMGNDTFAEVSLVNFKLQEEIPMLMAYSGGEICPTTTQSEMAINRFHNNAFVACLF
jgi:hypothetical protein